MSDENAYSTGASKPGRSLPDDHWQDLVAAVVSVRGSSPVNPPASMLREIERRLGFIPSSPGWWRSTPFLFASGLVAAVALGLGWLAWRDEAPRKGMETAASSPGVRSSLPVVRSSGGAVSATITARSTTPAPPVTAATGGAGIVKPTKVSAVPEHSATTARTLALVATQPGGVGQSVTRVSGGHVSRLKEKAGDSGETTDTGDSIQLKSDYYVAGLISAAMQNPVSANPFEPVVQANEWSDWVSGYELGSELPSAEALALGATWTWRDPSNLSLVSGVTGDDPSVAASVAPPAAGAVTRIVEENNQWQGVPERPAATLTAPK